MKKKEIRPNLNNMLSGLSQVTPTCFLKSRISVDFFKCYTLSISGQQYFGEYPQYYQSYVLCRNTPLLTQAKATNTAGFFHHVRLERSHGHLKIHTPKCSPEASVCLFGRISGVCFNAKSHTLSPSLSCIFSKAGA